MDPRSGILLARAGGMFAAGIVLAAFAFVHAIRSGFTQDLHDSVAMAIYGLTAMTMFFHSNRQFTLLAGDLQDGPRPDAPPRH